jgi:hypothetical protein
MGIGTNAINDTIMIVHGRREAGMEKGENSTTHNNQQKGTWVHHLFSMKGT